ncbi:hypothetical protein MINTM026_55770 [Mycobacterium intracellulare]|nr:hypothetical protein MINTM026_55770 [Mycobacterium intracellulare]
MPGAGVTVAQETPVAPIASGSATGQWLALPQNLEEIPPPCVLLRLQTAFETFPRMLRSNS